MESKVLRRLGAAFVAVAFAGLSAAPASFADAIISNGTVQVGVKTHGHLNTYEGSATRPAGRYPDRAALRADRRGVTAPGCLCEG